MLLSGLFDGMFFIIPALMSIVPIFIFVVVLIVITKTIKNHKNIGGIGDEDEAEFEDEEYLEENENVEEFCAYCGSKLEKSETVCKSCGAKAGKN